MKAREGINGTRQLSRAVPKPASCIAIAVGQISPASAPQPAAPAPGPSSAYSQVETRPLDPFTRVALCVPFTVLVQPSTGYQVTIEAESAVREAVTALIDGNTLILEASAFTTQQQIKVTVGLPASNLSSVTARGTAPVIVSPGFSSSMLMINAQGTGSLGVLGVNYTSMQLVNSGTGTCVVSGLVGSANIRATGTGATYLAGLTDNATVSLTGTGSIYINSTAASASISGSSTGTGKVFYTAGSCNVQSTTPEWIFGPKCQQGPITVPDTSATWTCGIQVTGRYACSGGSGSVQNTNTGCTAQTVTFPTAGSVSSYSLVDSKVGNALGLDTNTPQSSGTAGGGGSGTSVAAATPVNGVQNGQGNTGSNNGMGNGGGSQGAGNGNFNGNGNFGSGNGNNNGVGSIGNGNGQNNGNNNSPYPSGR